MSYVFLIHFSTFILIIANETTMALLRNLFNLVLLVSSLFQIDAFAPTQKSARSETSLHIFDKIGEFFEELDAFVDDATSRRLGAGASFYGKRKSNFYGKDDKGRKRDRSVADPTEDYRGPTSSGFFQWVPDENGQLRPVTRMKKKLLERNIKYEEKDILQDK